MILYTSVYGMGRGAGNLNTELFVEYLNDNIGAEYNLKQLLNISDEIIIPFFQRKYWGYSLPYYLSAKHNAHPNYADFLDSRQTLTVESMEEIFSMMLQEKRTTFDKRYIELLYLKYMETGRIQESRLDALKKYLCNKQVLVIAPGCSSQNEKDKIIDFAQRELTVSISVNFDYTECKTDFVFLSNLRRFREMEDTKKSKCIVTSNIPTVDAYLKTSYESLLNNCESVKDNAGMMLIKFLINLGVRRIILAGMDGYSVDALENYGDPDKAIFMKKAIVQNINDGMNAMLEEFSQQVTIEFLTEPKYISLHQNGGIH